MSVSNESVDSKDKGISRVSWLGYGAEILTIFFALAVLTGRVYAQSYWNVFGLSAELIDTDFINYAIMSPNTVLASVLMAIGTVALITFFRRQPHDFIGDSNPRVCFIIGWLTCLAGLGAMFVIMKVNFSTWSAGTAGIAFGLGYIIAIGGEIIGIQAGFKLEKKETKKWEIAVSRWLKNVPFVLVEIVLLIGLVSIALYAILDTAQNFGTNEAKMMYDTRPWVTLQLDSPKGFEDLALTQKTSGSVLLKVRIITEAGGFLYISPGLTQTPLQLHVRAVPVSRVQSIQYVVDVTPLGE